MALLAILYPYLYGGGGECRALGLTPAPVTPSRSAQPKPARCHDAGWPGYGNPDA